ncbi:GPO family capsid scaffolding protein [Asticcacaulis solisilvae]|uniref:GPO family capsid scaffolding protein n=1 Tax=Asticcacaulis solisilvae TaxID=1217274 RepID=UPI003FD6E28B
MAKSKFIRVAVSGPTIDGRTIDPAQLQQAAKNYNPDTYAARANIEHIRGATGQAPFKAVGDVLALKAEPVTIDVAGKPEQRVGLFAQIDAHDDLVALNKDGQKLYSSVELLPNFSGTNEAYLVGLAVTDSPASLGTERLQFTAHAKAYGNLVSTPDELKLELEAAPVSQTASDGAFKAMGDFFSGLLKAANTPPATPAPAVTPPAPTGAVPAEFSAFATQITQGMQLMSAAIEAGNKAHKETIGQVAADLAAFKTKVESTPSNSYTARPPATGGNGQIRAEC